MAGRAKRSRFPFLLLLPGSMTANFALPVGILSNRVGCFVVGVMVVVVVLLLLLLGVSASCGVAAPAANGCGDFEWRNLKSRPLGALLPLLLELQGHVDIGRGYDILVAEIARASTTAGISVAGLFCE